MWQGCPENARINVGRGNIKLRPWEENLCLKPPFAAFPVGDLERVMTEHDPVVEAGVASLMTSLPRFQRSSSFFKRSMVICRIMLRTSRSVRVRPQPEQMAPTSSL
jgi:hypothetical protein